MQFTVLRALGPTLQIAQWRRRPPQYWDRSLSRHIAINRSCLGTSILRRTEILRTVGPPSSTQEPLEDHWAPDKFQGNWGYARLPNPTPTALNLLSCSISNEQEVDHWADTLQFQEARVRSTQPEQDPTQPNRLVHRVQCGALKDQKRRIKATALRKQHQSTQTNRSVFYQSIVDRVAEWTAAIDLVNPDFEITTDVFRFGKLAQFLHHFGGSLKV